MFLAADDAADDAVDHRFFVAVMLVEDSLVADIAPADLQLN